MDSELKSLIFGLLNAQHDYAEETIKSFQVSQKNIYIFGAGVAGKLIRTTLEGFNVNIYRFVDNNAEKIGTEIAGVPIVGFQELAMDNKPKTIVIGTVAFHDEIVKQCLENGISPNDICLADFLHYEKKEATRNYFLNNIDSISKIYSHCADRVSKELFISNLLYQFTRNRQNYQGQLSPLSKQYYETEIVHLSDEEVYFDCGAKDGDTAQAFYRIQNGKYKRIFAFEPDGKNFVSLQNNVKDMPNIDCINAGVGELEGMLAFNGNVGGHSSFQATGELLAKIVPLDHFLGESPTLIKMDIEGFELNALRGAKNILQQCRPKLAICVYHKPCDIVELPKYILEQRDDYRIFFRLYRNFGHDLVCYCV